MAREAKSGNQSVQADLTAQVKRLLADPGGRIALHDVVVQELRRVIDLISDESFPVKGHPFSKDEFASRLARYEDITKDLRRAMACTAYWGKEAHHSILALAHSRLAGGSEDRSGVVGWLALRSCPLVLTLYCAGIAAVAARNSGNLAAVLSASVSDPEASQGSTPLAYAAGRTLIELDRSNAFSTLPGHERHLVPRSEYLFNLLRPEFDDLLFLGRDYEACFDEFEVFLAFACACSHLQEGGHLQTPLGRFAWKARRGHGDNPLQRIRADAEARGSEWPPFRTGLFPGGLDQFREVAAGLAQEMSYLRW